MMWLKIGASTAATILHRLFGHIERGVAFRLWDGTMVMLGGAPVCTVVLHRQQTFIRLVRDPSPLNFAEAYVEGVFSLPPELDPEHDDRIPAGVDEIVLARRVWPDGRTRGSG